MSRPTIDASLVEWEATIRAVRALTKQYQEADAAANAAILDRDNAKVALDDARYRQSLAQAIYITALSAGVMD